jgi:hypothetical protein
MTLEALDTIRDQIIEALDGCERCTNLRLALLALDGGIKMDEGPVAHTLTQDGQVEEPPPEPESQPEPQPRARSGRAANKTDAELCDAIIRFVAERAPTTSKAAYLHLRSSKVRVQHMVTRLLAEGKLREEGNGPARRLYPAGPTTSGTGTLEGRILAQLQHRQMYDRDLEAALDLSAREIGAGLMKLMREGEVEQVPGGAYRAAITA